MRLNLNQLRVFEAVARTRSFSHAAGELSVTQPAVTVQVRHLERQLAVLLFERIRRRPRLSQAGEVLYRYAQRIFALADEAADAVELARGLKAGRIRLIAGRTPAAYHVPPLIAAFKTRYPDVQVQLVVESTARIMERILGFEDDIAILGAEPSDPALVREPFCNDRIVLIVPPRHPWAARRLVRLRELSGQPLIHREPGSSTRALIEKFFAAEGIVPTIVMELGSNEAIKRSVEMGNGVALISASIVRLEVEAGRLVVVNTGRPRLLRPFFLAYHRDRASSPFIGAVLEVARTLRGTRGKPRMRPIYRSGRRR